MDQLKTADRPVLSVARVARRKEHLMTEFTHASYEQQKALRPTPGRSWRKVATAAVATAIVSLGLAIPAVSADAPAVWNVGRDIVGTDVSKLQIAYHGGIITSAELRQLNDQGRAMVGVHNRELSCQGIALYFDTPKEADVYGQEFSERQRMRVNQENRSGLQQGPADPCATYRNAPQFVKPSTDAR